MSLGCMCNIPPQETLDELYASYEELGGTKDELIKKAVQRMRILYVSF